MVRILGALPLLDFSGLVFSVHSTGDETNMPAKRDMKILVADDAPPMRRIITNILFDLGFKNVVEANNGAIALRILATENIDFIITDWNMPEMSGLDLLKAIRSNASTEKLPVLMVTAETLQENIVQAARAGVNNYIMKPFDAKTLAAKIEKIFE